EVYARHQIFVIKEPFLSDIFRFKFREFVQCFDAYVNNMSGGCSAGKTMQKKLQYLKEGYETKFTDLKERILEDMKSCVQRDGIGTPMYRKTVVQMGDMYRKEMDGLIAEFRVKCSDVTAEFKKNKYGERENPIREKTPTSEKLDVELKRLLDYYWKNVVTPLLRKFHFYLEETLCLTFRAPSVEGQHVEEVLHSLQIAKRRFGDALWHARRDSKRHMLEAFQHTSPGSPEFSQAASDILEEWQENMTPHMRRFTEELSDVDSEIERLYVQKRLQREKMPKGDWVDVGNIRIGKIFDNVISPLTVDYGSCLEDLSELDCADDTAEGKFKVEAFLKLKNIRKKLEETVFRLKSSLKLDTVKEKLRTEDLGNLIERYCQKLRPFAKEFKSQMRQINKKMEDINKNHGLHGRRELSTGSSSPWHFKMKDDLAEVLTSIPKILDIKNVNITEPYLDDMFRQCYRRWVVDFNNLVSQLLQLKVESADDTKREDALAGLKDCIREFGEQLKYAKEETFHSLTPIDENSEEYEKCVRELIEKTQRKLNDLHNGLNSKLYTIRKPLFNSSKPIKSILFETQPHDDLTNLLREYWRINVIPLVQKYHGLLEDIICLPEETDRSQTNNITHTLKLGKRKLGDLLWNARLVALNDMSIACRKSETESEENSSHSTELDKYSSHGINLQEYVSTEKEIFEDFRGNVEPSLKTFGDELERNNGALQDIYKRMNFDQPSRLQLGLEPKSYVSSTLNDSRLMKIFDTPISILILEYDDNLEELCKLQANDNSHKNSSKNILDRLKRTRDFFRNAINTAMKKFKDKLDKIKIKSNGIRDLIVEMKGDLLSHTNEFKTRLNEINNDLASFYHGKVPIRPKINVCWSPWQLPSAQINNMPPNDRNNVTPENKQPLSQNIPSSGTSRRKYMFKGSMIQEPEIYDCFQVRYWKSIDDFDTILCRMESVECQRESSLYMIKKDTMMRLVSLRNDYQKDDVGLRKLADADVGALGEKYAVGSDRYRKLLPKIREKYEKKLTKVQKVLYSKLARFKDTVKEKFPEVSSNRVHQEHHLSKLNEYLTYLLSYYWREDILPRVCKYLNYLEEINHLNFNSPKGETEIIYRLLRALQMAKRLLGDEIMSQRRSILRTLVNNQNKLGRNSLEYVKILERMKDTWRRNMAPRIKCFDNTLSTVKKELKQFCRKDLKPSFDKRLEVDYNRLSKFFDDNVITLLIDCDYILETLPDFAFDTQISQSRIRSKFLLPLRQMMENFWRECDKLNNKLNTDHAHNFTTRIMFEKNYDDYSSKVAALTAASRLTLNEIKNSLRKLRGKEHPTFEETTSKVWLPPSKYIPLLPSRNTQNVSHGYFKGGPTMDQSKNSKNQYLVTGNTSKIKKLSGNEFNPKHKAQAVLKPKERVGKKIFNDIPIFVEPRLDDVFRHCYRENVKYLESFLSGLKDIQCKKNTPQYEAIQLAMNNLSKVFIYFTKTLANMKETAAIDLSKILNNCKPNSRDYWQQVSRLLHEYKKHLKNVEDDFKSQMKSLESDTWGVHHKNDSKGSASDRHNGLGNIEFNELLSSILTVELAPLLQSLQCWQEEMLIFMTVQKSNINNTLYPLFIELLREKRRLSDYLWQEMHDFFKEPGRYRDNNHENYDEHSHIYADLLNALRRKMSKFIFKFKDKMARIEKDFSKILTRGEIERSRFLKLREMNIQEDRFEEIFENAIFVSLVECDGTLESLGAIVFNDESSGCELLEKFVLSHDNFLKELERLKSELQRKCNNKKRKDLLKIKSVYNSMIDNLLQSFQVDLYHIGSSIRALNKKLCIPESPYLSSKYLMPWCSAGETGTGRKLLSSPTSVNQHGMHEEATSEEKNFPEKYARVLGSASEKSHPKNQSSTLESHTSNQVELSEPFISDTFQDDYRVALTSYDKIIKFLKRLDSISEHSVKDSLDLVETAFKEYKRKSFILKDKIAAKLIEVCQSLEVDSQEYRSKISALLKEIKEKLKIIHDTFDKELHEVREPVKSNPSVSTGSKSDNLLSKVDSELTNLLSIYWKTDILPRILRFHRCLEGINTLILKLNPPDLKDIYKLLRSLQAAKRKYGDVLWHARREFIKEVENKMKVVPTLEYSSTFDKIKTSWRNKLTLELSGFSRELEGTEKSLDEVYRRRNIEKPASATSIKVEASMFRLDNKRLGRAFCDAFSVLIVEYDCRLDDLSKLILDANSTEWRSKSDAFCKLLNAWSGLFSSILKIKEELIDTANPNSTSILESAKLFRSKLKAPLAAFRSLLISVDSTLGGLAAKLGLCFRQYSTSVPLSPWRIRIQTDEMQTDSSDVIKAVANTML
ncbi:unnamed protein product, partial [Bemisia tabaci]